MCRSIKQLRDNESPATDQEVAEAALQYVRKVTGFRSPSRANRESFDLAVAEVAAATRRVLVSMAGAAGNPPHVHRHAEGGSGGL